MQGSVAPSACAPSSTPWRVATTAGIPSLCRRSDSLSLDGDGHSRPSQRPRAIAPRIVPVARRDPQRDFGNRAAFKALLR
jgi:hypothetical protein